MTACMIIMTHVHAHTRRVINRVMSCQCSRVKRLLNFAAKSVLSCRVQSDQ